MDFLKNNKYWILGLLVVAGAFFYIGKNSNPAKVTVVESTKSDVKADEKASGLQMGKRTVKVDTKANGDKKELTVEEFLSAYELEKSSHEVKESAKSTTTVNSVLFVRGGAIAELQKDGLPNPKVLDGAHVMGSLSYGAHELVIHSNFKGSSWGGYVWGFGF